MLKEDRGGHVHQTGFENHKQVPTYDFDYDEIDERLNLAERQEESVSFADASSALILILSFICQGRHDTDKPADPSTVAAKAEAIFWMLSPTESRYESLTSIAAACGYTKAMISKVLLGFRDQCGFLASGGKLNSSRDTFRQAQLAAVKAGVHSSAVTKRRKAQELADMNGISD